MNDMFSPVHEALQKNQVIFHGNDDVDSRRIFHGRGRCYDGLYWLNIDYFAPVVFVTVYRIADHDGDEQKQEALVEALTIQLNDFFSTYPDIAIIVQRRDLPGSPNACVLGRLPEHPLARRGDLSFHLSFQQQNTGYFLDIEPARCWLERQCTGKRVLNLFAYTCAFSVVAAAAGATSVVNMDMSRNALNRGRENHRLNGLTTTDLHFFAHDIFKSWSKLRRYGPYDIVIIDPPSFQKGSFIAAKDYCKTLRKIPDLLAPEGVFLACLNAPEIAIDTLKSWVSETLPSATLQQALPVADGFTEREGEGALKMLVYGM